VKKLGDPHFRQRELASETLRAAGPRALAALKEGVTSSDLEIRQRAQDLVSEIEGAQQMAPKRVTLREVNKPVKDVVASLAKASGYTIDVWSNNTNPISIQCVDKPFWEVIDEISGKAGLMLQQNYGDDRVRLNSQEHVSRFVDYSGPFRIAAQSIQQNKLIDLANNPNGKRSESLSLQFVVFSEPRMPILGLGEAKLTSAIDSDGNSLVPPSTGGSGEFRGRSTSRYGNGYRMISMQSSVQLRRQNERAKEATLIKGQVPATLLLQQEKVLLTPDLLSQKGKKLEAHNFSFLVEQAAVTNNGGLELKLTITDKSRDNSDMSWMNSLMQRIEVTDPKGNRLSPNGTNWHSSGQNFVQIGFNFGPSPTAAKPEKNAKYGLSFQSWKTTEHLVTFELKNIPLP